MKIPFIYFVCFGEVKKVNILKLDYIDSAKKNPKVYFILWHIECNQCMLFHLIPL